MQIYFLEVTEPSLSLYSRKTRKQGNCIFFTISLSQIFRLGISTLLLL